MWNTKFWIHTIVKKMRLYLSLIFYWAGFKRSWCKKEWENNRIKKYTESLAYFLRSVSEGTFRDNGFEVSLVYKPLNTGVEILESSELTSWDQWTESSNLHFSDFLEGYNYNIDMKNLRLSWLRLNYPSITIDKYGYSGR